MPELDQRFSTYATRICWQTVQPFGHVKSGYFLIRFFHTSHNAPYVSPKILHNLCFSFLLGIATVPREIGYLHQEVMWPMLPLNNELPKIDTAHKQYLTREIWEETHLREIFYGTLIFQQSSMICIGHHVGGHTAALQHGGQNYFFLISC